MEFAYLFGRHPGPAKAVDKAQSHRAAFCSVLTQHVCRVFPDRIVKSQTRIAKLKIFLGYAIVEAGGSVGGAQCPAVGKAKPEISLLCAKDPFCRKTQGCKKWLADDVCGERIGQVAAEMQVIAEFLVKGRFDPEEAPLALTHGDHSIDPSVEPCTGEGSRSAQGVQFLRCRGWWKYLVIVDKKATLGIPGVPVSEGVAPCGQIESAPPLPHTLVLGQVGRDIAAREMVRP
jgi:hypothetical protein